MTAIRGAPAGNPDTHVGAAPAGRTPNYDAVGVSTKCCRILRKAALNRALMVDCSPCADQQGLSQAARSIRRAVRAGFRAGSPARIMGP